MRKNCEERAPSIGEEISGSFKWLHGGDLCLPAPQSALLSARTPSQVKVRPVAGTEWKSLFLPIIVNTFLDLLSPPRHHFNRMLLRTVALLLLCVSVGMCATLVSYQTVQTEQGVPAVDIAAASQEAALDPELGSDPPADPHGVDNSTAGGAGVDLPGADGAGTDQDRPSGDASMLQDVTAEGATPKQPSPVKEGSGIRPAQTKSPSGPLAQDESGWSLRSIRQRFQAVHGYFDSLVELAGGQKGVCQYRCRHGKSLSPESSLSGVSLLVIE